MEEKRPRFPDRSANIEQAKAALREVYRSAADAVFVIGMKEIEERTPEDERVIQDFKSRLVNFSPELMDERFKGEVDALIRECNAILDAPMKQ